jgi:hypothetical protein
MKVTDLKALDRKHYEPNTDVIETCEELLKHAKSGEIQCLLAVAGSKKDAWTHSVSSHNGPSYFTQMGGLYSLLNDTKNRFEEA